MSGNARNAKVVIGRPQRDDDQELLVPDRSTASPRGAGCDNVGKDSRMSKSDPSSANPQDAGHDYVGKDPPMSKRVLGQSELGGKLARAPRPPRQPSVAISVHEVKDEKSNHQKTTNAIDATLPKDGGNLNDPKTANAGNSGAAAKRQADTGLEGGFASIGRELDDNAPLWRVYRDDVRSHDQNVTLDEWNKTLDVLLIFAGLFSAVVAALVVATVPLLNPQEDYVAIALYTLARSLDKDTTLSAPEPAGPAKSSSLWINGLWFASLFLALSVAFFAILAKQWLVEYNHRMADPPADPSEDDAATPTASLTWARRRGFFFDGFEKWHVPALVTQILPLLLHVALFLFLVGLAIYIWTLHRPIACGMIAFTALLFAIYFISTVLPVWHLDCPTATPLVRQVREVYLWLAYNAVCAVSNFSSRVLATKDALRRRLDSVRIWDEEPPSAADVKAVQQRTLQWMILVSGSESAISLVFQSLGALHPITDWDFIQSLKRTTAGMSAFNSLPVAPTAVEVVRAIRSELVLGRGSYSSPMLGLDLTSPMIGALKDSYWPDAKLLWAFMNLYGRSPVSAMTPDDRQLAEHLSSLRNVVISYLSSRTSTSLRSTALLLLRSTAGCPRSAVPYLVAILALEELITEEARPHAHTEAAVESHDPPIEVTFYQEFWGVGLPASIRPDRLPASSGLYHLLDGDQTPICRCAHTAATICTALAFDDKSDCQIVGWIIHNCSRKCRCEEVAPEWRAIRQLFAQPLGEHPKNLYQGADTWKYFGALLLTLLSLGDAAVHVLDYASDYEVNQILKFMLELDFSKLPSIRSEIWLMVLIRTMTSRRAPSSVVNLQWLLAAACVLQRRGHLNQAVKEILKFEVETLLESPTASGSADSSEYRHFSHHLVEFDGGYESRLEARRKDFNNVATPGIAEPGECVTCGFQPGPVRADAPGMERLCSLGSIPVIQTLMREEMELGNKDPRIAPKIWALLLPLLDSNSLEALNSFALATLLAGVCYLPRRGGDETLQVATIERVLSALTTSSRQLEEATPLSKAVKALGLLQPSAIFALESFERDLAIADQVDILDWMMQPGWSLRPAPPIPTHMKGFLGHLWHLTGVMHDLREIVWRHMATRRLADVSDDSIDVTRTRRVIAAAKSLGPLPAGAKNEFAKDAAEKIVAAYTQPADPVHSTASDARPAASSSST